MLLLVIAGAVSRNVAVVAGASTTVIGGAPTANVTIFTIEEAASPGIAGCCLSLLWW